MGKQLKTNTAQVSLEFSLCMIVVLLMIFSTIKILEWSGRDLVNRRIAHDGLLTEGVTRDYGACRIDGGGNVVCGSIDDGPRKQIKPDFYLPGKLNAIYMGE